MRHTSEKILLHFIYLQPNTRSIPVMNNQHDDPPIIMFGLVFSGDDHQALSGM